MPSALNKGMKTITATIFTALLLSTPLLQAVVNTDLRYPTTHQVAILPSPPQKAIQTASFLNFEKSQAKIEWAISLFSQDHLTVDFRLESHIFEEIAQTFTQEEFYLASNDVRSFAKKWYQKVISAKEDLQNSKNLDHQLTTLSQLQELQFLLSSELENFAAWKKLEQWQKILTQAKAMTEMSVATIELYPLQSFKDQIAHLTNEHVEAYLKKAILSGLPSRLHLKILEIPHRVAPQISAEEKISTMDFRMSALISYAKKYMKGQI